MSEANRTVSELPDPLAILRDSWELEALSFRSNVPGFGRLIAAFRQIWYSVAARWQDLFLSQQQSQFNHAVYRALERQRREIELLRELLYERSLEAGILAEGLAQLELELRKEDRS